VSHVPGHIGPHRPFVSPEEFISDPSKQLYEDTKMFSGGFPTRAELAANPLTPWIPGVSTATYWPETGPVGKTLGVGMDIADILSLGWLKVLTGPVKSSIRSGITDATSRFRPAQPVKDTPLGPHSWYGSSSSPEAKKAIEEAYEAKVLGQELNRLDYPGQMDAAIQADLAGRLPGGPMKIKPSDFVTQRGVESRAWPDQLLPVGTVPGQPMGPGYRQQWRLEPMALDYMRTSDVFPDIYKQQFALGSPSPSKFEELLNVGDMPPPRYGTEKGFMGAQDVPPSMKNPYIFGDYLDPIGPGLGPMARGELTSGTVLSRGPREVYDEFTKLNELIVQRLENLKNLKAQGAFKSSSTASSVPPNIPPAPKGMYTDLGSGSWFHPYNVPTRALVKPAGTLPFTMPARAYFNELME